MIEVNVLDSAPGEGELLRNAALYFADRLFTKSQQKKLTVIIDITAQPIRVPITRDMLMMKKGFLGASAPSDFELTVSTAAGLRDAMEVVAHELIHVSQVHNLRLTITKKKRKYDGEKRLVHMAKWLSGKATPIEELEWHNRPWEIEACSWQPILVNEFVGRSMGVGETPVTQKPKKKQLALYKVATSLVVPAGMGQAPMSNQNSAMVAAPISPANVPVTPVTPVTPVAPSAPVSSVPTMAPVTAAPAVTPVTAAPLQAMSQMPEQMPIEQQGQFGNQGASPPVPQAASQATDQSASQPVAAASPAFGAPPQTASSPPVSQHIPPGPLSSDAPIAIQPPVSTELPTVLDDDALIAALGNDDNLVPPVDISEPIMTPPTMVAVLQDDGADALPDDLSAALSAEIGDLAPAPASAPSPSFDPVPAFDPAAASNAAEPPAISVPEQESATIQSTQPNTQPITGKNTGPNTAMSAFGAAPDLSNLPDLSALQTPAAAAIEQAAPAVVGQMPTDDRVAATAADSTMGEDALADMLAVETDAAPPMMVDVPGLDAPRALSHEAVSGKLDELLERGLISAEEAAIARSEGPPTSG